MKRLLVTSITLALALSACGGKKSDSAASDSAAGGGDCSPTSKVWNEPGVLTVATGEPAYPPYVIDDKPESGEGFESAVVYAVADKLGFTKDQVKWTRTTFDQAIAPGDKAYDFNIQQYDINADREKVVDFSSPYYEAQPTVVALKTSDAVNAKTFDELKKLKWGGTIGTIDYDYIVKEIGVPEADVAVYNTQADTFAALDAGQIDATVIGLPTALYETNVELPQATIVGLLPRAEGEPGFGMVFTKGNPARDCVNGALKSLTDDGTLTKLDQEWMQSGGEIPEIKK